MEDAPVRAGLGMRVDVKQKAVGAVSSEKLLRGGAPSWEELSLLRSPRLAGAGGGKPNGDQRGTRDRETRGSGVESLEREDDLKER